jgi:hypothetical protein
VDIHYTSQGSMCHLIGNIEPFLLAFNVQNRRFSRALLFFIHPERMGGI